MSFEESFKHVVGVEGGYSNKPNDPGGETMFGITKRVALANGYKDEMSKMPLSVAKAIYKRHYWDVNRLDEINSLLPEVAHEMFDTGVNIGVSMAATMLQRSLNALNRGQSDYADIKADGVIGPMTLYSLQGFLKARPKGGKVLLGMLNALQGARYIEISEKNEKLEDFVFGWFTNRVVGGL